MRDVSNVVPIRDEDPPPGPIRRFLRRYPKLCSATVLLVGIEALVVIMAYISGNFIKVLVGIDVVLALGTLAAGTIILASKIWDREI